MIRLVVRRLAKADIKEARAWYEERQEALADAFIEELDHSFARIVEMPLQFPDVWRGVRRAMVRRFPYAIYFVSRGDREMIVLAAVHLHRHPKHWKRRRAP